MCSKISYFPFLFLLARAILSCSAAVGLFFVGEPTSVLQLFVDISITWSEILSAAPQLAPELLPLLFPLLIEAIFVFSLVLW